MSTGTAQHSVPATEAIDDFGDLYPRPVGINRFVVLSLSAGGFTAYQCNIDELTCECRDLAFNREEGEICKHLAAALYQSPEISTPDTDVVRSLSNDLEGIHDEIDHLAQQLTVVESELTAVDTPSDDDTEAEDNDSFDGDPVEYFESLLRDKGLPVDAFNVYIDDELGSLQVEQDGYLEDDEFNDWVEFSNQLELGYDGDSDRNYLQATRFGEVFG
jgi:hypothetical protein